MAGLSCCNRLKKPETFLSGHFPEGVGSPGVQERVGGVVGSRFSAVVALSLHGHKAGCLSVTGGGGGGYSALKGC